MAEGGVEKHALELDTLRTALAAGDLAAVIATISSAEAAPAVIAAAAHTLRRMVHNRRGEIGHAGGVEALLGAMKGNAADASLQNACCQALYGVIDDGERVRAAASSRCSVYTVVCP